MARGYGLCFLSTVTLSLICPNVSSFVNVSSFRCKQIRLEGAANESNNPRQSQQAETTEAFMENASKRGAERIASMSIAERTKRAMLAEAVEDRIFSMNDDLELLLEKNGTPLPENREKVKFLVREIKASEEQYEALVTGEPSSMLGALDAIGDALNGKDEK